MGVYICVYVYVVYVYIHVCRGVYVCICAYEYICVIHAERFIAHFSRIKYTIGNMIPFSFSVGGGRDTGRRGGVDRISVFGMNVKGVFQEDSL